MCSEKESEHASFYLKIKFSIILLFFLCWLCPAIAQTSNTALWLDVDGAIGPASHDYIKRSLATAAIQNAQVVIIRLNTPGGLDVSMREIIQEIIASPVPVISYVAPSGARAASAGTYILYASHIAVMAPATNLGAATPVKIGGFPGVPDSSDKKPGNSQHEQSDAQDLMTKKIVNDAVAYIRGLAQMRGRNAEWAEKAVREAVSLTANEALGEDVIDLIAVDIPDLLTKIDGRIINIQGQEITLSTQKINIQQLEQDWRTRLLAIITDPNIAYILMLIGIYGLIFEFANPGTIIPGVVGAVCLLLALFAFQVLPVNYAGLALIFLGIVFMLAEMLVPSFGALGIGGMIAFVMGSIMLLDMDIPGYGISIPLIATVALMTAGFFLLVVSMAIKARQRPVVSGKEELIGNVGEVTDDFDSEGWIRVHGELWRAKSNVPLHRGQKVRVTAMKGLMLQVEVYRQDNSEEN
ncbi:nodulation protein NfeD [Nitrosomonas sp. Nm58]|uniref:NfeD family protein n=1 Tax=Nitrosomonas sp. Nm58 TaxID=200126 RepID=UPI000899D9D8|nr:nodulation protein NfeD [Nitrosomonas sp. Nm58]SDY72980.1 membrane-bound serine protease (ClpP class) [Nitrosomonas sp. Nm58]